MKEDPLSNRFLPDEADGGHSQESVKMSKHISPVDHVTQTLASPAELIRKQVSLVTRQETKLVETGNFYLEGACVSPAQR